LGRIETIADQQQGLRNHQYNDIDQLTQVVDSNDHGISENTLQFCYDALGRRINKKVLKIEPTRVKVVVEETETKVKTETNTTDAKAKKPKTTYVTQDILQHQYSERYVWQGQNLIQTRHLDKQYFTQRDEAYLYNPGSHTPLAIRDSDLGILHLDTDHLGTPKAVYEHDTGEEIWHTAQDVYGKTQRSKTQRTHPKTGQAFAVNLRFQGQYEDVETGLYYNLNRYYDPSTGRYINHDPIGMSGGLNLYQYCPNPVEWVDPLGLVAKEESCPKAIQLQAAAGEAQIYAQFVKDNWDTIKPAQGARKPSTIDVIVTKDGQIFRGYNSRKGHPNFDDPLAFVDPRVKNAYDGVPISERMGSTHGKCAEPSALSQALVAGADLNEAISVAVDVKTGAFKEACDSCFPALNKLGVIDGIRL